MEPAPTADAPRVLTRAALRAADRLDLSQRELGAVLGVSEATVSRLAHGRTIDPASKEGELAVLFVRLFRSLDSIVGGEEAASRAWLHSDNDHLGGVPAELVQRVEGLVRVVEYVDAMRAKN